MKSNLLRILTYDMDIIQNDRREKLHKQSLLSSEITLKFCYFCIKHEKFRASALLLSIQIFVSQYVI